MQLISFTSFMWDHHYSMCCSSVTLDQRQHHKPHYLMLITTAFAFIILIKGNMTIYLYLWTLICALILPYRGKMYWVNVFHTDLLNYICHQVLKLEKVTIWMAYYVWSAGCGGLRQPNFYGNMVPCLTRKENIWHLNIWILPPRAALYQAKKVTGNALCLRFLVGCSDIPQKMLTLRTKAAR